MQIKEMLTQWVKNDKKNIHKGNLLEFMQERICFYANQEATPSEQIKGMNRLLRDIRNLDDEMFEEK